MLCSEKAEHSEYFPQEYGLEFYPFTQTYPPPQHTHTHAHNAGRMCFFPLHSSDFLVCIRNHILNSLHQNVMLDDEVQRINYKLFCY